MHCIKPELEDKENLAVGTAQAAGAASTIHKTPTTLPTLYVEGFRESLFLDFGQVPVASSKALTFAISGTASGPGRVEIDRCPKGVHVSLGEKAGLVEWGPTTRGSMRKVLLLRYNKHHRLQITLLGRGVAKGAVTMISAADKTAMPNTNAPSTTTRQPLHTTLHHNQGKYFPQGYSIKKQQDIVVNNPPFCDPCGPDMTGWHGENDTDQGCIYPSSSPFPRLDSFLLSGLDDATASVRTSRQSLSAPSSPLQRQRGRACQRSVHDASLASRASSAGVLSEGRHCGSSTSSTVHKPSSIVSTSTHHTKERPHVQTFRQEKFLVEWLNFALCPPDAAQSKPGDFLKRQDDEIEAQMQAIYNSAEMGAVQHAIKLEIGRKRLQLRSDRDLHMDLSLREAFLELLLSYNLPWLRIGLEVLLKTDIATARLVKSRDGQLIRVRKLIVTRILSDPTIAKAYAGRPSPKVREAMKVELCAHTLERFLSLVILLDQAKRMGLLPRRCPLFKSTARIKSSAAILHSFAKEYMAGEGNLARHLLGLGYGVEIQQQYLEEFDFRTTALSRDLRDGVRLVRLVEILTAAGDKDGDTASLHLSSSLRVPAISRLQKVHNVKLALEALRMCGFHHDQAPPKQEKHLLGRLGSALVLGRLCPDDIVDGHREKTLSLLWAIARHFQLDYVVSSLTGITRMQSLIKSRLTRHRFLRIKHLAVTLQRLYRARRVFFRCHSFSPAAAVALQSAWRGVCVRRQVVALRASILTLQARAKGFLIRRRQARLLSAVRLLQVYVRAHLARLRHAIFLRGVVVLQRLIRRHQATMRFRVERRVRMTAATTLIASIWKGHCVRLEMRQRQDKAVFIQAAYRRYRLRHNYLELRRATVNVQAWVRGGQARRQLAQQQQAAAILHRKQISAVILIGSTWKGFRVRGYMRLMQSNAVVLQAAYRRRRVQRIYLELRRATVCAQALVRGWQARRQLYDQQEAARDLERQQILAVTFLASVWKGYRVRAEILRRQDKAVIIQAAYRRCRVRRIYLELRRATINSQALIRGAITRRQLAQHRWAANTLTRHWHARQARKRFSAQVGAAIIVQRLLRGHLARRESEQQRSALLVLQGAFRCYLLRKQFLVERDAAIMVQRFWRSCREQRRWRRINLGMVALQAFARGRMARCVARGRAEAVLMIQKTCRGFLSREALRWRQKSAQLIQKAWGGYHARCRWALAVRGVVRCQTLVRGRKARQEAGRRRNSLLLLQRVVRRFVYDSHREKVVASVHVQRLWRGYALRKKLVMWTQAATRIKAAYKGSRVRQAQRRCQLAARCLQSWVRAGRARRHMLRLHRAVVLVQAAMRGWLVRRISVPEVRVLRTRVLEATARAEVDPSLRLGVRHAAALEVLLSGKSCAQLLRSCLTLVVSTSLARECCEALVEVQGVPKLLAVIRSCNRSTPHMELLRNVLSVLGHVTAHPPLLPALGEAPGAVESLVELLQTYRPDDHTFLPAARLLLNACECGAQARIDLHHPSVQRRLQGSLRLLERKAEVEKKSNSKTAMRLPKGEGKEVGLTGPIRVLRSILNVTATGKMGKASGF